MSKPYTGGCACGAIRYEIKAEPVFSNECQCRHCQQRSGSGHGSWMAFASRADVTLNGEATEWDIAGDSGTVKRHAFCPTCGTPVFLTIPAVPNLFIIAAGSLDEPARYAPQVVTYASRAHALDRVDPGLARFETMPPAE
jgi:hypothetical protein